MSWIPPVPAYVESLMSDISPTASTELSLIANERIGSQVLIESPVREDAPSAVQMVPTPLSCEVTSVQPLRIVVQCVRNLTIIGSVYVLK